MPVKSYEEATAFITAINHALALRNFVDPRKDKCKFACTLIYDVSMIGAINSIVILNQIHIYKQVSFTLEILLYVFSAIIMTTTHVAVKLIGLYNSKDALALIKQIDTVDEKLMKLGAKIEYRRLFQCVIINGFFWMLGWIITVALIFIVRLIHGMDKLAFTSALCTVCMLNIASIALYDFNTIVHWLGERFKQTNELLGSCLLENDRTKADSIDTIDVRSSSEDEEEKMYLVHEIRLVHLRLCYMSKMFNRLFETQISLHVFMTLVYTTVIIYYGYMELSRSNEFFDQFYEIIVYVLNAVNHCAKIAVVSYNCEHATSQTNKVIEIIHRSPLYEKDTDIKDEMIQFCFQISCMRVGKLQCASLWFNYGFVCQCIYAVLTNTIVMIQWSGDLTMIKSRMLANETNRV